jgi:uncharacterized protein
MMERALITGASSGIGLALAREFADNGHPLVIVSPNEGELVPLAGQLERSYGVEVIPIPADLTDAKAPAQILEQIEEKGLDVHTLVNNAGVGQHGEFARGALERDIDMIRLNIEAVVRLTKLFVRPMIAQRRGRILNVASVAAFEPGPFMAVYHASKAFVLSFTEALAVELEETPITVTALCPGITDTDFVSKARMTGTRMFQRGNVMSPAEVARIGYEALQHGEPLCVPGAANKAMVAAQRLLTVPAAAKLTRKLYEGVPMWKHKRHRGDVERNSE